MKEFFKELLAHAAGFAAFIMAAVIAFYMISCLQRHEQREPRTKPEPVKPWKVSCVERDVVDIEHNGHKFIVLSGDREYSILHAPYCPCKEKANEKANE